MEDMAPELLQTIRLAWQKALISDAELRSLTKRITEGKATYKEVEDVAYRVGKDLSKALVGNITSDIMPDGHVPQNVAEKILQPTLREAHAMVIEAATKTQEAMNKAAGIGLKAQAAEFDAEKAQGLVYKLTNGLLEDTGWILDAPVTEFVQSSADRTLKKNVDFQARAGLHPIITREAEGKCCEWCSNLEGSYEYGDEPKDIYRRHRRCRCVVDYRPGNGKRQNVWSKAWHEDAEPDKIEKRKQLEKEFSISSPTSFMKKKFKPVFGEEKTITHKEQIGLITAHAFKVNNSAFEMYVEKSVPLRNRMIRIVEAQMKKVAELLPDDMSLPTILICDFEKAGISKTAIGGYNKEANLILFNSQYKSEKAIINFLKHKQGWFANTDLISPFLHETGHAYHEYLVKKVANIRGIDYSEAKEIVDGDVRTVIGQMSVYCGDVLGRQLSGYAMSFFLSPKHFGDISETMSEWFTMKFGTEKTRLIEEIINLERKWIADDVV